MHQRLRLRSLTRANPTLENTLECQILTAGLQTGVDVKICYPNAGDKDTGEPVKVRLESGLQLLPIMDIGDDRAGWGRDDATGTGSQVDDDGGKITGDVASRAA